jgi:hypothetical protein
MPPEVRKPATYDARAGGSRYATYLIGIWGDEVDGGAVRALEFGRSDQVVLRKFAQEISCPPTGPTDAAGEVFGAGGGQS